MTLKSTLAERTGLTAGELEGLVHDEPPEALAPVLPPEGIVASRLRDVAARAIGAPVTFEGGAAAPLALPATFEGRAAAPAELPGRLDVAGVRGCAAPAIAAAIARAGRPAVLVTDDIESARRAASDLRFLVRGAVGEEMEDTGQGEVLLLETAESSPYADSNPDRGAAMSRMATLVHLAHGRPWSVLVVPAVALARKVPPRSEIAKHADRIALEEEIDRDALVRSLSEAGYLRVPIVEDPGSFAVRGSLVDVWSPSSAVPVRVELYGDLVVSIKAFDPIDQTTNKSAPDLPGVWLSPVREAVLDGATIARARARVTHLAEAIDWPTTKTRALVDDVTSGRAFFGADGFLPAYYADLDPLLAYVPRDAVLLWDDPPGITQAIREELARAVADHARREGASPVFPPGVFYRDEDAIVKDASDHRIVALHRIPVAGAAQAGLAAFESSIDALDLASRDHEDLTRAVKAARASKGKNATLAPLVRRIAQWREHGLRVFVTARAQTQAERLALLLRHQGVPCRARLGAFEPGWLDEPAQDGRDGDDAVQVVVGSLARGVVLPADGLVLVTEEEIFGSRVHRRRERSASKSARPFVEDLRNLAPGDYVVHVEHGIGKYLGLVHKALPGRERTATGALPPGLTVDLIAIEYAAGDKLYLPVWRLNQIEKYVGGEGAQPKLDRLGGSTFARTKARVAREVRKMADELLRVHAERQALPGDALPPAGDEYRAFEATFPFDETADQSRAIDDVGKDLESPRPMDRLVCGDVGFGKTEVALRAAFRVAMAGKQVALLCPTTVLVQQHYRTFVTRMAGYPLSIRALSRFQTKKEIDETLRGMKEGKVDIVIGTHRLLSKDVHYRSLGLLVVDEEQRFGVSHKERIKQLRAQVDVLTLTATPIPRTLQMAVTGMRDLSLITTAPLDRRAVRTIVTRWDEQVVREAVQRELSRGGQCFYVYNRIDKLYEKAQALQALVPNARIAVAHGQMNEAALEETMLDFVDGRYDVLVSTAIVESGLDIPRANTMLIDRADLFGLAQLYQLRGRVGRSKERAYCYLIVPPPNAMTDDARSRIEALERHTELGSGFHIASLDLELRGAGDLLGAEQSGNVASVGFDMFCRMLEQAVQEMRGGEVHAEVDTDLSVDVEALLPEDYVTDVGVRLSLYKRLASAIDEAHVADIAAEMEDRFGSPPEAARRLVQLMALKTELRRLRALGCEANARVVTIHLRDDTPLDPAKVAALVRGSHGAWRLTPDMRLVRRFDGTSAKGGVVTSDGTSAKGGVVTSDNTVPPRDGIANAEAVLGEIAACLKAS